MQLRQSEGAAMIELRPRSVPGETPLLLAARPRPILSGTVRPLLRGAVLAACLSAALGLPAIRAFAADRVASFRISAASDTGLAAPRGQAIRPMLVRGTAR
jgi:hypothetical protein